MLEAALGGKVEGEEDEEEGYAVGGCFVAGEEEDECVAEDLGGTDRGGYFGGIVVRGKGVTGGDERDYGTGISGR